MSSTVGTVIIDLKADVTKLIDGMQRAENTVKKTVKNLERDIVGIGAAFLSIQTIMKAFDVGKNFTATAMEFEKFDTVLKTIEGSSTKAKTSMDWINEFTKSTPYQLADVTDSFVKLKAYGIDPIDGTLRTLGDTASAMGKPLNQAVEAMADAVTGENERLKEFGIKASKTATQTTYSWTSASGVAKEKIIENNSAIIQSTLESIFNSKYAGAMDAQSKTLEGMLSNINDSYTIFQKNIMSDGLYDYIKALTKIIGEDLNEAFKDTTKKSGEFTHSLIDSTNNIIRAFGFAKDSITGIKLVLTTLELGFYTLAGGIALIMEGPLQLINGLISAYNALGKVLKYQTIDFKLESSIPKIVDKVTLLANEIVTLSGELENGSKSADDFISRTKKAFEEFQKVANTGSKQKPKIEFGDKPTSGNQKDLDEIQKKLEALQQKATDIITSDIDKINNKYIEMYDSIQGVWSQEKMQKFYKAWNKEIDTSTKKAEKGSVTQQDSLEAVSSMYSDLTGVMTSFYDEDDDRRKKQQEITRALSVLNMSMKFAEMAQSTAFTSLFVTQEAAKAQAAGATAVAVAAQSSPWTGFATAAAMIAMLASIGVMLSGGGSSSNKVNQFEVDKKNYEAQTDLITSRLDRQIALLESIDGKQGIAASSKLASDRAKYNSNIGALSYDIHWEQLAQNASWQYKVAVSNVIKGFAEYTQDQYSVGSYNLDTISSYAYANTTVLQDDIVGTIKWINYLYENIDTIDFAHLGRLEKSDVLGWVNDAETIINDFALGAIESIKTIKDAGDSWKGIFDDITSTNTYALQDLQKAYDTLNINDATSLSEYLKTQITAIEEVQAAFTEPIQSLLLSQDVSKLNEQTESVIKLQAAVGDALDGGVKEALNFVDSIKLLSTVMKTSLDNKKTWEDSFLTDSELIYNMIGTVATSMDGLDALYRNLSNDIDGLTNADLDLLNANKSLLESYKDLNVGIENSIISTTESIMSSLGGVVNDTNALTLFNANIATAMTSTDRSAIDSALQDASKYTSALTNKSNFATENDMLFSQAIAKNQLSSIKFEAESQITYLKDMNTKFDTLNGLVKDQANEIVKLRKEIQDQTFILYDIEENIS